MQRLRFHVPAFQYVSKSDRRVGLLRLVYALFLDMNKFNPEYENTGFGLVTTGQGDY